MTQVLQSKSMSIVTRLRLIHGATLLWRVNHQQDYRGSPARGVNVVSTSNDKYIMEWQDTQQRRATQRQLMLTVITRQLWYVGHAINYLTLSGRIEHKKITRLTVFHISWLLEQETGQNHGTSLQRRKDVKRTMLLLPLHQDSHMTLWLIDTKSMNRWTFLKMLFNGMFPSETFVTKITTKLFVVQMYW